MLSQNQFLNHEVSPLFRPHRQWYTWYNVNEINSACCIEKVVFLRQLRWPMTDLCCHHLSNSLIDLGAAKIKKINQRGVKKSDFKNSFICLQCDRIGSLEEIKSGNCVRERHAGCVRFVFPFELYCLSCCDFQFSSNFDDLVSRTRTGFLANVRGATNVCDHVTQEPIIPYITKGMINMGATCFMSSILQVLLHNPLVVSSGHLRFSMETCKRQIKQDKELEDKRLLLAKAAVTSHAKAKNTKTAVGVSVTAGCICCEFKKLIEESTR